MQNNAQAQRCLNIIMHDDPQVRANLLPLTFTRPVSELLAGIFTIREAWQNMLPGTYSYQTIDYLDPLFPMMENPDGDNLIIESHFFPTPSLVDAILSLRPGQSLYSCGALVARRGKPVETDATESVDFNGETDSVTHLYDLFQKCGSRIEADFSRILPGLPPSAPLPDSCTLIGSPDLLYIHPLASVEGAIINTLKGPVFIDANAEVMEGSCLRGPIAVLHDSHVNMGARVYGPTVIGAWCKVGGEINNVVFHPYTNKAHDGFLGNAVIGSWCNLGAGCTASNLKNDYSEIKLWNYPTRRFLRTGLQFCGLIMGDHSKAGINTMFNTATVVGVGVNIHGTGFPRNFVASFSEGSATAGFTDVPMSKFRKIAERVMARRGVPYTEQTHTLFEAIRGIAESYK